MNLGDRDRQTWAVERSVLQVRHQISMFSSFTRSHHTEIVHLVVVSIAMASICSCHYLTEWGDLHFMTLVQRGRSEMQ